jgi:hypothetical protein
MLYLARFRGIGGAAPANSVLVEAEDAAEAIVILVSEFEESPAVLHEVPRGVVCAELRIADPPRGRGEPEEDEDETNPANVVDEGMALVPTAGFCVWLDAIEDMPLPDAEVTSVIGAPDAPELGEPGDAAEPTT